MYIDTQSMTNFLRSPLVSLKALFNPSTYRGEGYLIPGTRQRTPFVTTLDIAATLRREDDFRRAINISLDNGFRASVASSVQRQSGDYAAMCSAFYSGVKIISRDIRNAGVYLGQKVWSEDKGWYYVHAKSSRWYRMFSTMANPGLTWNEFIECMTARMVMYGNAYAIMEKLSNGEYYFWPLSNADITEKVVRVGYKYVKVYTLDGEVIPEESVFDLRGFSSNGYSGDDVRRIVLPTLELYNQQQAYASNYFQNDATPRVIVERPSEQSKMDPDAVSRMKEAWVKWHGRSNASGEPGILQEGMTAKIVETDHSKAQLTEQREFQIKEVARALPIPEYKLGLTGPDRKASVEQLAQEYVKSTMEPIANSWADAVRRKVFGPREVYENILELVFDFDSLSMPSISEQGEHFAILLEKGVYKINDVRLRLGLPPIPGGGENFIQSNMGRVEQIAKGDHLKQPTAGAVNPASQNGIPSRVGKSSEGSGVDGMDYSTMVQDVINNIGRVV